MTLPLLVACMTPVRAQDASAYLRQLRGAEIPMADAQFVLYQNLAGSGDADRERQLQAQVQTSLEFGNARFYALIDHMQEAVADAREFADSQNRDLCVRRAEFETVKSLGEALNASVDALRTRQAQLVEAAKPILGAEGETKFAALIAEYRQRMVVSRVDYVALLITNKIEVDTALDDICRQVNPPAQADSENR